MGEEQAGEAEGGSSSNCERRLSPHLQGIMESRATYRELPAGEAERFAGLPLIEGERYQSQAGQLWELASNAARRCRLGGGAEAISALVLAAAAIEGLANELGELCRFGSSPALSPEEERYGHIWEVAEDCNASTKRKLDYLVQNLAITSSVLLSDLKLLIDVRNRLMHLKLDRRVRGKVPRGGTAAGWKSIEGRLLARLKDYSKTHGLVYRPTFRSPVQPLPSAGPGLCRTGVAAAWASELPRRLVYCLAGEEELREAIEQFGIRRRLPRPSMVKGYCFLFFQGADETGRLEDELDETAMRWCYEDPEALGNILRNPSFSLGILTDGYVGSDTAYLRSMLRDLTKGNPHWCWSDDQPES